MSRRRLAAHHQSLVASEKRSLERFVVKDISDPSSAKKKSERRLYFVDQRQYGPVWANILMFLFLHVVYMGGLVHLFRAKLWHSWIFGFWYSLMGGIGVTCGAHRLWSHRSYKASLR